jgi:hypothetical protein
METNAIGGAANCFAAKIWVVNQKSAANLRFRTQGSYVRNLANCTFAA